MYVDQNDNILIHFFLGDSENSLRSDFVSTNIILDISMSFFCILVPIILQRNTVKKKCTQFLGQQESKKSFVGGGEGSPSRPVLAVDLCIAMTSSYIFQEVHIRLLLMDTHSHLEPIAQLQSTSLD